MPEGEPIEHPLVTRSIESAQRKVEAHNFDIRKQLLEYDNVANDQRRNVYQLRNDILQNDDVSEQVKALRDGVVTDLYRTYVPAESVEEQWDLDTLETVLRGEIGIDAPVRQWLETENDLSDEDVLNRVIEMADRVYTERMSVAPPDIVRQIERSVLLQTLDMNWREHLAALDQLRQGIHLRGYAQKDPKQEYKREAFELFGTLVETVKLETTRILMRLQLQTPEQVAQAEAFERNAPALENVQYQHPSPEEALVGADAEVAEVGGSSAGHTPFVRSGEKVGRNDPCPCGSGKKYKHCHGKLV
jgi:Preprotein translocase subunit SecA (ATPase, RNA helicase)